MFERRPTTTRLIQQTNSAAVGLDTLMKMDLRDLSLVKKALEANFGQGKSSNAQVLINLEGIGVQLYSGWQQLKKSKRADGLSEILQDSYKPHELDEKLETLKGIYRTLSRSILVESTQSDEGVLEDQLSNRQEELQHTLNELEQWEGNDDDVKALYEKKDYLGQEIMDLENKLEERESKPDNMYANYIKAVEAVQSALGSMQESPANIKTGGGRSS